jgi:hypothetical protein
MLQVIGFEGGADDSVSVTYGAAAFSDSAYLYNPVTGSKTPIAEWEELVEAGHVTRITPHGPLMGGVLVLPCYVLRARLGGPSAAIFGAELTDADKCLETWQDDEKGWQYWLWPSFEVLELFARKMASKLRAFADVHMDPAWMEMKTDARVLDPWDGKTQEEWCNAFARKRQ